MKILSAYRKQNLYVRYTIMFAVFSVIIFLPFLIRHNSLVSNNDNFNQYYPVLCYLAKYYKTLIPSLLSGHIPMYDTAIGFGDDIIGTLGYYGLGDIFTLPAVLFPDKYMSYAFSLCILARLYFGGLNFAVYAKWHKFGSSESVVCALMYVFSFYGIGIGLSAFSFLTGMVWFPLMMLGIDLITSGPDTRRARAVLLLIVPIFFQALCGFYYIYMDILGGLVYFIVSEITGPKNGLKKVWTDLMDIFVSVLLGIGSAAVLFIPQIFYYFQAPRNGAAGEDLFHSYILYDTDELLQILRNVITPVGSLYEYGLSVVILVFFVAVWLILHAKREGTLKWAVLCGLALYGYFFPAIGTVMNGFSHPEKRWMYIAIFWLCAAAARNLPLIVARIRTKDLYIYGILYLVWLCSALLWDNTTVQKIVRIAVYSLVWGAGYIVLNKCVRKNRSKEDANSMIGILSAGMALNLVLTGFLGNAPVAVGGAGLSADFKSLNFVHQEIEDSAFGQTAQAQDDRFERSDINDTSLDASLYLDKKSTFLYYSMCNGHIFDIFEALRISPAIVETYCLQGLDQRQVPSTILNVGDRYIDTDNKTAGQNEYYLPLGTLFRQTVSESALKDVSCLDRMNVMMKYLIVDEEGDGCRTVLKEDELADTGKQEILPAAIEYDDSIVRDGNTIQAESGAAIRLTFDPKELDLANAEELYVQISNLRGNPAFAADVDVAGSSIRVWPTEKEWFYHGNYDYLVNVSSQADKGEVVIVFQTAGTYSLDDICLMTNSVKDFESSYSLLQSDAAGVNLEDTVTRNNQISGTVNASQDGQWLMLSIPYSNGWSCLIDGQKTAVREADYSFMAVKVPQGTHHITWVYRTPGINLGIVISIVSAIAVIVLLLMTFVRAKR